MTKTTEFPRTEAPPGLFIPEIENDLTRREFLIGAGLIIPAPGCGNGEGFYPQMREGLERAEVIER